MYLYGNYYIIKVGVVKYEQYSPCYWSVLDVFIIGHTNYLNCLQGWIIEVKGELMIFNEDAELNIETLWYNWPLDLF